MEQLQHHGITGTVPKHVLSDNMKNFTAFPLSAPADDGFIHLLGKGICSFPNNCSMTFRINAPYHFFYVYEGTLSVTDEHHTCRLADRHASASSDFRSPHDRNLKRPLPLFPYVYFRSRPPAVSHTAPITSCLSDREFFYVYSVPYDGAFTESAERHF